MIRSFGTVQKRGVAPQPTLPRSRAAVAAPASTAAAQSLVRAPAATAAAPAPMTAQQRALIAQQRSAENKRRGCRCF